MDGLAMTGQIHIALASVYRSEAAVRRGIEEESGHPPNGEYRGLWAMPTPERGLVHVFTPASVDPTDMTANGWVLASSRPPGPDTVEWTDDALSTLGVHIRELDREARRARG